MAKRKASAEHISQKKIRLDDLSTLWPDLEHASSSRPRAQKKKKAPEEYSTHPKTVYELERRAKMSEGKAKRDKRRRALNSRIWRSKDKLMKSLAWQMASAEERQAMEASDKAWVSRQYRKEMGIDAGSESSSESEYETDEDDWESFAQVSDGITKLYAGMHVAGFRAIMKYWNTAVRSMFRKLNILQHSNFYEVKKAVDGRRSVRFFAEPWNHLLTMEKKKELLKARRLPRLHDIFDEAERAIIRNLITWDSAFIRKFIAPAASTHITLPGPCFLYDEDYDLRAYGFVPVPDAYGVMQTANEARALFHMVAVDDEKWKSPLIDMFERAFKVRPHWYWMDEMMCKSQSELRLRRPHELDIDDAMGR